MALGEWMGAVGHFPCALGKLLIHLKMWHEIKSSNILIFNHIATPVDSSRTNAFSKH